MKKTKGVPFIETPRAVSPSCMAKVPKPFAR